MEQVTSLFALQTVFHPAVLVFMIPIVAIVLGVGAGIIKSMQDHQMKMAELMHKNRGSDPALLAEIQRLRFELDELRDRVNQAALASDDLNRTNLSSPPSVPEEIRTQAADHRPG